jgi:hypothetical protein
MIRPVVALLGIGSLGTLAAGGVSCGLEVPLWEDWGLHRACAAVRQHDDLMAEHALLERRLAALETENAQLREHADALERELERARSRLLDLYR